MKKISLFCFIISLVIISTVVVFLINNNKRSEFILISSFKISSFDSINEESDYSKIMWDILMDENNIERMQQYLKNVYGIKNSSIDFEIKKIDNNKYRNPISNISQTNRK